jgi:hypothetical protein
MSRFCFCSTSGPGVTAEFDVEPRAASVGVVPKNTALFELRADQPHPELGGGLFALLQLPHKLPGTLQVKKACMRLNQLEMAALDIPPHFGAWCPGRMGGNVAYVSFLPNFLHDVPDIALKLTTWAIARARWAGRVLREPRFEQ